MPTNAAGPESTAAANAPTDDDDRVARAFSLHYAEVRGVVARVVGDADVASELTSESFVRLIIADQAGRFPDKPRAWLFRVATNLAASHGRHRSVETRAAAALEARYGSAPHESPEDGVLLRERLGELRHALDGVMGDGRVALLLSAEGYDGRAIASRIGRTDGATRTLLSRTRAPLRRALLAQQA
jgi:RNA polymerase sigma factor (sigma-70 family)